MSSARQRKATPEIRVVAKEEGINAKRLTKLVASGRAVIVKNVKHQRVRPVGIGEGLSTKVNANVGTSPDLCDVNLETKKVKAAVKYGADTVMDLSTSGDLGKIRRSLMRAAAVPFGTVPIYEAAMDAVRKKGSVVDMTEDDMLNTIERHARDGVDFMTIHCGVTRRIVERIVKQPRLMGIVSRGGSFLAHWIVKHDSENPLYKNFDQILDIAGEYDLTLSLGDGLRPGCIFDASDWPQVQELLTIGTLIEKAREKNVQAMVEGPGHLPLDQVVSNVRLEKSVCDGAPFYVLGPVVTEVAAGYDHIVGAIGGAVAGMAGADFLCVVTPSEHLGFPNVEDVRLGVVATKIAAHACDLAKLAGPNATQRDREMAKARANLDWGKQLRLLIDPERAREIRNRVKPKLPETCSMCGYLCAIKLTRNLVRK